MLDLHSEQCDNIVTMLERGVQTMLLVGDRGVGKKTLVRRAVAKVEHLNLIEYPKLAIDDARQIKQDALRSAIHPRVYLIDGDNATETAYNAMLKTLEEPPKNVVIVICAAKPPLSTVVSRCNYVMIPPLTEPDLKRALAFRGMSERAANSVIPYARGSVTEAFNVYETMEQKRRLVPFIKALKDRDLSFVLTQTKTISREDIYIMIDLIDDVFMSRYGMLQSELSNILAVSPDFLMLIKDALQEGASPAICWMRAYFRTGK